MSYFKVLFFSLRGQLSVPNGLKRSNTPYPVLCVMLYLTTLNDEIAIVSFCLLVILVGKFQSKNIYTYINTSNY